MQCSEKQTTSEWLEAIRLDMNLQPVVVLEKLSEEDIKFYTKRAPYRRSGRRKQLGTHNLRDEQHVDFSCFEEYRRSRNSYLKKKARGKRGRKPKEKKTGSAKVEIAQTADLPQSNLSVNAVLGNNDVNKVKSAKAKQPRKRKSNNPDVKVKKSCKKKFKRMIIESDSDCSVENYGIVYCNNEGSVPLPDNSPNNISSCFSHNSFPASSLLFNNSIQSSVSCSRNTSPSCAEVIVNEKDILSALDCDADDEFYSKVIKDKLPNLNRSKKLDCSDLLGYLSGNSRDGNESSAGHQLPKACVTSNASHPALNMLSEQISMSWVGGKKSETNVESAAILNTAKCKSDNVVKESYDVVSRIMQDMDVEYERSRKFFNSSRIPKENNFSKLLPGRGMAAHASDAEVAAVKTNEASHDTPKGTPIIHSVASAIVESVKNSVSSAQTDVKSKQHNVPSQNASKLVKICSKCRKPFSQGADDKTLCDVCTFSNFDTKNSVVKMCNKKRTWNSKLKSVRKARLSPVKRHFKPNFSPLKKFKPIRQQIVKNLSLKDRSRLLYKNNSAQLQQLKPKKSVNNTDSSVTGASPDSSSSSEDNKEIEKQTDGRLNIDHISAKEKSKNIEGKTTNDSPNETIIFPSRQSNLVNETKPNKKGEPSSEEIGYTMKSIDRGLMLMTFPESGDNLDLSFDSCLAKDKNASSKKPETQKQNADNTVDKSNQQLSIMPPGELNIKYTYVLPTGPRVTAHYLKTDIKSPDFHLQHVSYENQQSGEIKALPFNKECSLTAVPSSNHSVLPAANASTLTGANASAVQSSENDTSKLVQAVFNEKSKGDLVKRDGVSTDPCTAVVPFKTPASSLNSVEKQYSKSFSENPPKENLSSAITQVLHELDAIAILSILDLDGNDQHANTLLENLLLKEIEEYKQLKELNDIQDGWKDVNLQNFSPDKLSQSKLGRIRSLVIARSYMEQYGKLTNIAEAILSQSVSKDTSSTGAASASSRTVSNGSSSGQNTQLVPYVPNISKVEKNKLSDCALAKSSNQPETIFTDFQNSPSPVLDQTNSMQTFSFETRSPASNHSPISAAVKDETPRTSSSCMLQSLLVSANTGQERSTQQGYALNSGLPQSSNVIANMHTTSMSRSSFTVPSLTDSVRYSSQSTQNSPVPSTANFNSSIILSSLANAAMTSVPVSSSQITRPPAVSPRNVKSENQDVLPSCQLQSNSSSSVDLYNNCAISLPQMQQQNPVMSHRPAVPPPYRAILPASHLSKPSRLPCPNQTVPFTGNVTHPPMNFNRSMVPFSYGGGNIVSMSNNSIPVSSPSNSLRIQQVVLPSMQPPAYQPQNALAITPYSYAMQQQPAVNQMLIPPQSVAPNVFTVYPTATQNLQTLAVPPTAPHSQNNLHTALQQVENAVPPSVKCVVCSKPPAMRCKQCAKVVYCSTECAKIYWNQKHKLECKLLA